MFIKLIIVYYCLKVIHCDDTYNIVGFFEDDENNDVTLNGYVFDSAIAYTNEFKTPKFKIVGTNVTVIAQDPFKAITATCDSIREPIVAIFGPNSVNNIVAVQSVCDSKEIPHILTRWMNTPLKLGSAINFYPHAAVLTEAYIDIIREWQWKTFTVLYENDESLLRLSGLILYAKEQGLVVTIEQLDRSDSQNYRESLKNVWRTKQRFLVIDCSISILYEVLIQCQQVGLMTSDYNYLITNLDAHTIDLAPFMHSETNITGMRIINPQSNYVHQICEKLFPDEIAEKGVLQTAGELKTETALIFDAIQMFSDVLYRMEQFQHPFGQPLDCLEPDSWKIGYSVVNSLKTSSYRGLTGLIEFNNEGNRSVFGLQIYELKEGGIITVAQWNSTEGINITRKHVKPPDLEKDSMRNKTFIVIISLTEPYGMNKETTETLYGNDRFEGFSIDLIQELAKLEGFNYTFVVQEDKKNGNIVNGRWTGMIGEVIEGRADMAITDLTITSDRAEAVDFTSPFMNLGVTILFQKATKTPPSFFSFAQPFALDTWIALAVAFVVVSLSFFLLGRICPDEWTNPYPCVEEPEYLLNQFSMTNAVWFATGAMLQQGSEIAPIAIPTRLVSGVWWFFVLIMVSSYTANLASFLVTESHEELFNDVESLVANAEKHGISYGAKANGATIDFFEKSTENNTLHATIAKYMREHEMPNDNDKGVEKAERERFAFFMESTTIEYITQRHCNLTMVGDRLDEKGYGIALKKDSPYRTRLSLAILKLQTSGEIEKIRKKWWEERKGGGQCTGATEDQTATPLDLQNVEGIFYVTIFGTILGVVLVIFEFLANISRISKRNQMPFKETFIREVKFFFKFNSNVKPLINANDDDDEDVEEEQNPIDIVSRQNSELRRSQTKSVKSKMTTNGSGPQYGYVVDRIGDRL